MILRALACVLILAAGCTGARTTTSAPAKPAALENTDWILLRMDKQERPTSPEGNRCSLRLMKETGNAFGFAGCNTYHARYTTINPQLAFSEPITTQQQCSDMGTEKRFMELLLQTNRYTISRNTLTLNHDKKVLLVFEHVSP